MLSCFNGHSVLATYLLDNGAEKNAQDRYKFTALHLAASNGHALVVEVLIRAGIDYQMKNRVSLSITS